jgi:hypothetical protein
VKDAVTVFQEINPCVADRVGIACLLATLGFEDGSWRRLTNPATRPGTICRQHLPGTCNTDSMLPVALAATARYCRPGNVVIKTGETVYEGVADALILERFERSHLSHGLRDFCIAVDPGRRETIGFGHPLHQLPVVELDEGLVSYDCLRGLLPAIRVAESIAILLGYQCEVFWHELCHRALRSIDVRAQNDRQIYLVLSQDIICSRDVGEFGELLRCELSHNLV